MKLVIFLRTQFSRFLFYTVYSLLRVLPLNTQEKMAEFFGSAYLKISPKSLELMVSNLTMAFGDEYTIEQKEEIAVRSFQNVIKSVFEFSRFPLYSTEDIIRMVDVEGVENVQAAIDAGKGTVLISAHFGNWELLAARVKTLGGKMTAVGRVQNDSLINDYIVRNRESKGTKNIPRGVPMYEHILELLSKNEFVGLVSDQNAGEKGLFVDFFGHKTSTFKGPGLFAVRTGCNILPLFIVREGYEKHRAIFCPLLEIKSTGDAGKDVLQYVQSFTKVIEEFVRKYPDHWFWIHKRWKTRPPGMKMGAGVNK